MRERRNRHKSPTWGHSLFAEFCTSPCAHETWTALVMLGHRQGSTCRIGSALLPFRSRGTLAHRHMHAAPYSVPRDMDRLNVPD
eukprot:1160270-Pelagomonas_calceolata.AAC.2